MPRTSLSVNTNQYANYSLVEKRLDTGDVIYTVNEDRVHRSRVESRQTVNTPDFRSLRRGKGGTRDDLPMNPFIYQLRLTDNPYGQRVTRRPDQNTASDEVGVLPYGVNFEPRGIQAADRSRIDQQAVNSSLSDLKDQSVNLGVMLGERREASQLILESAFRIADSLRALKAGALHAGLALLVGQEEAIAHYKDRKKPPKKSRRISPSKALANEWLSWQYGWMPLAKDAYNACELLAKNADRLSRLRISSSKSHRWVLNSTETWQGVPVERRETGIYTRKYVYVFSYSHEGLDSLSNLGITNPVSVAWELLPLSFVADWFFPIGSFLDAFDAALGKTFEKGCTTTFEKVTVWYRCKGSISHPQGGYTSVRASAKKVHVDVDRDALSGFPLPSLPRFSPSIGVNRGLSALGLLRQRFKQ